MLSLIKFFIKLFLFSAVVLVLGNLIHWNGRTVSDQIKTQLSHAEHEPYTGSLTESVTATVKDWGGRISQATSELTRDARDGMQPKPAGSSAAAGQGMRAELKRGPKVAVLDAGRKKSGGETAEELRDSERQKLKALIRDLNRQER